MDIYIVINTALHPTSTYIDIVGCFKDISDAKVCMKTYMDNIIKQIDNGDIIGFDNYKVYEKEIPYDAGICNMSTEQIAIVSSEEHRNTYYEHCYIITKELN